MTRPYSLMFILLLLISSSALADDSPVGPWQFLGAQDSMLNGVCSSENYLFATTGEGLHYYNFQTSQWTDRTSPGWIGTGRYATVLGQTHDQRLVSGGVNAWFKGTLFYSDNMGETDVLVHESQGGHVTALAASTLGDPALYACTWSDVVPGEFLYSANDGQSWSVLTGHGHHAMTDLAVLGPQEVFLAGDNYVAHTTDGGSTWENLKSNLADGQGIYCLLAMPPWNVPSHGKTETDAEVLLASNDSGLFQYDFETELWQLALPASCRSVTQRHHLSKVETYAVTWDGRVMYCLDMDWGNWHDITADLSPGTPLDVEGNYWGVFVAMQGGGVFQSVGWVPVSDVPGHLLVLALQVYPNPFNPSTTIKFEAPVDGYAQLQVFDMRGALVETLFEGQVDVGVHAHQWRPQGLSSGVYRAVLQVGGLSVHSSVVLLK